MYIHLALAGVGTIAMIALGIYFMMESSAIGDRIQDLDDKEMGSMLQALNTGGTWYAAGLPGLCVSKFDGKGCTECVSVDRLCCLTFTFYLLQGCRKDQRTHE